MIRLNHGVDINNYKRYLNVTGKHETLCLLQYVVK